MREVYIYNICVIYDVYVYLNIYVYIYIPIWPQSLEQCAYVMYIHIMKARPNHFIPGSAVTKSLLVPDGFGSLGF